jgi:hypothetical protein
MTSPKIQQIPFDAFDDNDLVVYASSEGYWNGRKQRWVKDLQQATVTEWYHAKLALACGDGRFEKVFKQNDLVVVSRQNKQ